MILEIVLEENPKKFIFKDFAHLLIGITLDGFFVEIKPWVASKCNVFIVTGKLRLEKRIEKGFGLV